MSNDIQNQENQDKFRKFVAKMANSDQMQEAFRKNPDAVMAAEGLTTPQMNLCKSPDGPEKLNAINEAIGGELKSLVIILYSSG